MAKQNGRPITNQPTFPLSRGSQPQRAGIHWPTSGCIVLRSVTFPDHWPTSYRVMLVPIATLTNAPYPAKEHLAQEQTMSNQKCVLFTLFSQASWSRFHVKSLPGTLLSSRNFHFLKKRLTILFSPVAHSEEF